MKKLHFLTFAAGVVVGATLLGSALAAGITANVSTSRVFVNGAEIRAEAYNIGGSNYFKLRDVAKAVGFAVDWDGANDAILIDTSKPYVEPTPTAAPPTETPFPYKVGDTPTACNAQSDYTFAFPNSPLAKRFAFFLNMNGVGGCNWYAEGRFLEVNGINIVDFAEEDGSNTLYSSLDYFEAAKRHTERLEIITDKRDVRSKSAVFCWNDRVTHMFFIEYVERDADGKPVNVYYTTGNTLGDQTFHDGVDGVVRVMGYEEFIEWYEPLGYVIAKS